MKRKNLIKLIVGVVLVTVMAVALALAGGCAAPAPAPAPGAETELPIYEFRCQSAHAPAETQALCRKFLDYIEDCSGGRVKFEVFSAGQLLPDDQIIPAIQAGTLDFAVSAPLNMSAPVELLPLDSHAPGRWQSHAEFQVLWHNYGLKEIWIEEFESLGGLKVIGDSVSCDPIHLVSTKPVWSYDDLKGMKIIADNTVAPPFIDAGATAIVLPVEEYYMAGITGVADGLIWAGSTEGVANGWYEAYPYFLSNPLTGTAGPLFMVGNPDTWNSLPSDIQAIFEVATKAKAIDNLVYYYDGESTTREYFNLTTMPKEDWAKIQASVRKVWDKAAAESEVCAEIIQILEDYDAMVEEADWYRCP